MNRHTGPDDQVEILTCSPAKKRPGLSLELFDRDWNDVHGPTCGRLGLTWQYTQFRGGHDDGGIWRAPEGVRRQGAVTNLNDDIVELFGAGARGRYSHALD